MKTTLISISLVATFIGCSPRVAVDQAQKVDFDHYKTFAWIQSDVKAGQNPVYYNNLATQQVEKTVNQVLNQRRYQTAHLARLDSERHSGPHPDQFAVKPRCSANYRSFPKA